jgi:nicotinamidase-related amidase
VALVLNPSTTAVLFMDFQKGIVARVPAESEALLQRARAVLDRARAAGALVAYVRIAFRPGYPELSERNATLSAAKAAGLMRLDAADTAIVEQLAPLETEPVIIKHRVGAFNGTDLETILRARKADTLVLLGISTSGVVLSTVRYAADIDYRLVVASDGCADADPEVHRVLTQKVFPRQATVTTTAEIVEALWAPVGT